MGNLRKQMIKRKNSLTFIFILALMLTGFFMTQNQNLSKKTKSLNEKNDLNALYSAFTHNIKLKINGWFNIVGHKGLCVAATHQNGRLTQQKCGTSPQVLWKK